MDWITTTPKTGLQIILSAAFIFAVLILFTRLSGLRSFSKMSAFDFAMTIAVGSILASVILTGSPSLIEGTLGLGALFGLQSLVAYLRKKSNWFSNIIDNQPRLLMRDGEIFYSELKKANVTESDLIAKLREANVLNFSQVRAVVLETTGDMSVLHSEDSETVFEKRLLNSVRGGDKAAS